jgi:ubiquinone/menaquinone biosynthesis C-methylase UbiE
MSRYDRFKEELLPRRLGTLRGKVLELGFGDADTLLHYGNETEVIALEKNQNGWSGHGTKLAGRGIGHVEVMHGSAEDLPFPDGTFDFVTSSFMLCSVGSQPAAIRRNIPGAQTGRNLCGPGAYAFP